MLRIVKALAILLIPLGIMISILIAWWAHSLNQELHARLKKNWFLPPLELYAEGMNIRPAQNVKPGEIKETLNRLDFRHRRHGKILRPMDYTELGLMECLPLLPEPVSELHSCIAFKDKSNQLSLITFSADNNILALFSGEPPQSTDLIVLPSELFAQYYGNEPILRRVVSIGEIPLTCSQAVVAIEDRRFFDHAGISLVGIFRAMAKNILAGRVVEGGSTLTQQLVKNYFLTAEQTFERKIKEQIMAVLLERQFSKDEILETYLNLIYMGANGPFQVRGFAAASEHYLQKPIEELQLAECALLAALLNSPGRYDPFRHPEQAKARRDLVLDQMLELGYSVESKIQAAKNTPLPNRPQRALSEPAPFYVDAIFRKLDSLEIDRENGLRIYTHMNVSAQQAAQEAVTQQIEQLQRKLRDPKHRNRKGQNVDVDLEGSLISVDLQSGGILSLVGGKNFKNSQYNRAVQGHRQVGSVMKPFVYLAALENVTPEGTPYTPLTPLTDEPLTYAYEGQKWSPENYEKSYRGTVPLFYALKDSMNVPTARLGISVGLENVIDVARRAGVSSPIQPLPSLSLGAFELYPMEVAQAFSTIARMGSRKELTLLRRVESLNGEILYKSNEEEAQQMFAPETVAVLIGMLKQTVQTGTAISLSTWRGFHRPIAGKTGTTSDLRDAWFVGFTPHILTVTWVGNDQNQQTGLTGSSGAIPPWAQFMKNFAQRFPATDFVWPEGVEKYHLSREQLISLLQFSDEELNSPKVKATELIFRQGTAPIF